MTAPATVRTDEAFALEQDAADPLAANRDRFHIPVGPDGSPRVYLAGQSLGAQPKTVREAVEAELDAWAGSGSQGHFHEAPPGSRSTSHCASRPRAWSVRYLTKSRR